MRRSSEAIPILALAGGVILHASDNPPASPKVPTQVLAFSQLVRVAQMNRPSGNPPLGFFGSPGGSDPRLGRPQGGRQRRCRRLYGSQQFDFCRRDQAQ